MVANGGSILFIGTKKQAQDPIKFFAEKCGMPYINERWLGGMLTNFDTIAKRVSKMQDYERMRDTGEFELMPKKEALLISRELEKLQKNLSGIRNMSRLPTAVFILDTVKESIAVTEANKLGLPVIAVVDTNVNPDLITYPIPGNDDAIRANELMCRMICEAVTEGRFIAEKTTGRASAPSSAPAAPVARNAAEQAEFELQQEAARKAATEAQAARDARVASAGEATPEA
jgi:small subunit ribosomal protein S2